MIGDIFDRNRYDLRIFSNSEEIKPLFTWSVHIHVCAIGGSEDFETIFNFCPSGDQHFSSDGQNDISTRLIQRLGKVHWENILY